MAELIKPCPYCGNGEIKIIPEQIDARTVAYNFVCEECCGITYFDYADREESIKAWNNRATEAEIRAKAFDEFAEKLKAKIRPIFDYYYDYQMWEEKIDGVAEQLKEE